jgi:hypothetical protein
MQRPKDPEPSCKDLKIMNLHDEGSGSLGLYMKVQDL